MSRSRYFENNLKPLEIHHDSLKATLLTLRSAIATALRIIVTQHDSPDVDAREGPYIGESGIALMYIRLAIQAKATGLSQDIVDRLPAYARSHLSINQKYGKPKPGHLAPLDSWVGHAVLEVIYELHYPSPTHHTSIWTAAAGGVRSAILTALEDEGLGGDEVLYGRAGLLWAMLVLHTCVAQGLGAPDRRRELATIINETQIGQVVGMIIQTGIHGAKAFKSEYHEEYRTLFGKHKSQDEIPLMWPWHGKFYLGAIHGSCDILMVLLQCPRDIMLPHLPHILMTVDFLMELASQHQGHLPSSLPARDRSHPYVQICHGSPGLLMLLATIRSTHPEEFEGIRRRHPGVRTGVMNAVWEQGLVQKGLGICHGVTGNAWPIMLLSVGDNALSPSSSTSSDDLQLSRALAFLVHATELPPLSTQSRLPYRTPDHPFSLFEGLSGAVCAWADACTIIEARLSNGRQISPVLGLPGLGGVGLISIM